MDPQSSPVVSVLKIVWLDENWGLPQWLRKPPCILRGWRGATKSPARSYHQDTGSQCMSLKPSARGSKALDIVDRTLLNLKDQTAWAWIPCSRIWRSLQRTPETSPCKAQQLLLTAKICQVCDFPTFYQQSWRLWVLISRLKQMVFLGWLEWESLPTSLVPLCWTCYPEANPNTRDQPLCVSHGQRLWRYNLALQHVVKQLGCLNWLCFQCQICQDLSRAFQVIFVSKQRVHSLQSLGNSNGSSHQLQETSEVQVLWCLNKAWGVFCVFVQEAGLGKKKRIVVL